MDFDELLELLEIESPDEFGYFEHFAALVESDEEIPYELFYRMLAEADPDALIDLTDSYFEEILQNVPEDAIDVYTLLGTIKQALVGLARNNSSKEELVGLAINNSSKEELVAYADELFKFRGWYIFDSIVHVKRLSDNVKKDITVSEALSLYRLEKLNEDQYRYDFADCLDYEIDEYAISIDTELDEEYEEIIEEDEDVYEEGLIDRDYPVIDGDFKEDEEEEEF